MSQLMLKITSPGVPEIYQGMELWNFGLADPDNRRPVNYDLRKRFLSMLIDEERRDRLGLIRDILNNWQDGRIKLLLTYKTLNFRRIQQIIFQSGDYVPLQSEGKRRDSVVAFARCRHNNWAITAITRFHTRLVQPGRFPLGKYTWKRDMLVLPEGVPSRWYNVLTGEMIDTSQSADKIPLAKVFKELPVALLTNIT
jgi:(1->4)-alpha-D-glucan 1-alpha-D-glucosylmutase